MGLFSENIHIISNEFEWDSDGRAVKVKEPIIYGMNKDETMIRDFPAYDVVKNRKNVILLGDNPEDIGMIKGFDYDNLLKIGFLNDNVEKNLDLYKDRFDVVIANDGSMDFVSSILKEILK